MADNKSNYAQPSFLGGEWSPFAQGRTDDPRYTTAMNLCQNGIPVEEGAWVRRSGFAYIIPTYLRGQAKLLPFIESAQCTFAMEFTQNAAANGGCLRFVTPTSPIFDNNPHQIQTSIVGQPAQVTFYDTPAWAAGDQIMLFPPFGYDPSLMGGVLGQVLTVNAISGNTVTLYDDTNKIPVDGTAWTPGSVQGLDTLAGVTAVRILRLTTPYVQKDLTALRPVQAETQALVLSPAYQPYVAQVTSMGVPDAADPQFSFGTATFLDGPYQDLQGSAGGAVPEQGTVSGGSGSITFTAAATSFTTNNLGQSIRLWSQPPPWSAATTYADGALVTDSTGAFWQSLQNGNTNNIPGTPPPTINGIQTVMWAPAPQAGQWAWGTIAAVNVGGNAHAVTVNLQPIPDGSGIATLPVVANGTTITFWQLGVFLTGQWPTCGTYHEGRLWLAGAVANRFDAGVSNGINPFNGGSFAFSPSDAYGNVADNHGISYTLNLEDLNPITWMLPDPLGILCGTLSGEILISASATNDPLTPTSIQVHRTTKYGCSPVPAVRAGLGVIFVQALGRRVIEYIVEVFTGRPAGRHLNEYSKHMTTSGITEMYYQEETAPILWCVTKIGQLIGCTYRRFSHFLTEPPTAAGWHKHIIGDRSRTYMSMCVIKDQSGVQDRLMTATMGAAGGFIETLKPLSEVND